MATRSKKPVLSEALKAAHVSRKLESKRREKLLPSARFGEDATRITSVVIRNLRKLGNLATRKGAKKEGDKESPILYEYSKEQRVKMYEAIRREVDTSESRYIIKIEGKKKGAAEFNF